MQPASSNYVSPSLASGRVLKIVILALAVFAACTNPRRPSDYGLPITLGSSSDDVRRVLGSPDYSYKSPANDRLTVEWYYPHGIVATFERDRLVAISLQPDIGAYEGFLPYIGPIIRGLKLTDKKQKILETLGEPTKVEADVLRAGTDPDIPEVWPKESRYYWRFTDYMVEIDFLNQAQSLDGNKHLTLPKDSVTMILLKK